MVARAKPKEIADAVTNDISHESHAGKILEAVICQKFPAPSGNPINSRTLRQIAKRTFKARVLGCLAGAPKFKDMDMVNNHVAKTTISNQISAHKKTLSTMTTTFPSSTGM